MSHCEYSSAALEDVFEALSSGGATEFPLVQPQLTLIQDYSLPLERYGDYEDDEGELRAESNLAEKFGESTSLPLSPQCYPLVIMNRKLYLITRV